ncbi:MAG: VOC family protein [Solirubrobacterales bacterium]
MAVLHLEHVGVVVKDLPAATEFFLALGLEIEGKTSVGGEQVDRIVGLEGAQSDVVILQTPGGQAKLELCTFNSPAYAGEIREEPSNAPGIRHVLFAVDDIHEAVARVKDRGYELVGELVNYSDMYWLCYIRGPEGIIVELAERVNRQP